MKPNYFLFFLQFCFFTSGDAASLSPRSIYSSEMKMSINDEFSNPLPFWSGFDDKAYSKCQKKLNRCPFDGPIKNIKCVEGIIEKNNECSQLKKLSDWYDVPPNALQLKRVNNFTIVKVVSIADAQTESYVITPQGIAFDGNIDVRKINSNLNKKYAKYNFMINNWGDWKVTTKGNTHQFQIIQKITNICLACPVILWANVVYLFKDNGEVLKILANSIKQPNDFP